VPYSKRWFGLSMLIQAEGSAIVRAILPALMACALNVVLHATIPAEQRASIVETAPATTWRNPFHSMIMLCTFMLVFRTQVSHIRFMDARTASQTLLYALHEVVCQCRTFSEASASRIDAAKKPPPVPTHFQEEEEEEEEEEEKEGGAKGEERPAGNGSGIARAPVQVVLQVADLETKEKEGEEGEWELDEADLDRPRRWGRRIEHIASLLSAMVFHALRQDPSLDNVVEHVVGTVDRPGVLCARPPAGGFRDTLMLRGGAEFTAQACAANPLHVLGGVSTQEASLLRSALDGSTECGFNLVHEWLLRELVTESCSGSSGALALVPPPILSRTFQLLGDAKHAAMQAKKITDTPLPFAYTQVAVCCTLFIAFVSPLMFACIMPDSPIASAVISFFMALFAVSLNEVARELEDPFQAGYANGIAIAHLQHDFNLQIRATARGRGPFWRTGRSTLADGDPYHA